MCIAIYKPKNNVISKDTLAECFRSNRDGAGFMYVEKKELKILKGFFTFDEFWDAYEPHQEKLAVIHFRIKTHGPVAVENCHPFVVNNGLGFIHNGIISGYGSIDHSDTRDFNAKVLQPLVAKYGNNVLFQPAMKALIEARIGYSKFVFLDRHGNANIFNEDKGVWDNGVWYSNTSYRPYIPTYTTPYKSQWQKAKEEAEAKALEKKQSSQPIYSPKLLTAGQRAFRVLTVGDKVSLTRGHWSERNQEYYGTGIDFEVIAISGNYTATLAYEDDRGVETTVYDIPFSKIDFADIVAANDTTEDSDHFGEAGLCRY